MRNYKLKSSGLPDHIYTQVIGIVRGYDTMVDEYNNIIHESPLPQDGQPRASKRSDPTQRQAIKRADIYQKIKAVENAIDRVPDEYRQGVWENAVNGTPYPRDADKVTYWRHKAKFLRSVAKEMCWI